MIIKENLYDENHIKRNTDLPFLVRMDNRQFLRPEEVISGYKKKDPTRDAKVIKKNTKVPPTKEHRAINSFLNILQMNGEIMLFGIPKQMELQL